MQMNTLASRSRPPIKTPNLICFIEFVNIIEMTISSTVIK